MDIPYWRDYRGRDREGDLKIGCQLVGSDTRVLATIDYPQGEEATYQVFIGNQPERDYLKLDAAKRYAEDEASELLLDEDKQREWRKEYRNKAKEEG